MAKLLTGVTPDGDPIVINIEKVLYYKPLIAENMISFRFENDITRRIKFTGDFTGMLKKNGIEILNRDA